MARVTRPPVGLTRATTSRPAAVNPATAAQAELVHRTDGLQLTPAAPGVSAAPLALPRRLQRLGWAALDRRAAGEAAIPFHRDRPAYSDRRFGVEIEFHLPFPPHDPRWAVALEAIGKELHKLRITSSPEQLPYHHSKAGYSTQVMGGWNFEIDGTVAGEVVSPILRDEPQTWWALEKVLEVIKAHGGEAGRAGLHVHVSTPDYGDDPEPYSRLTSLVSSFQGELTKIATEPHRGEHRGLAHCRPSDVPAEGYRTAEAARWTWGHGSAVNFESTHLGEASHVEHRLFDASLDPGTIQAQVKLSQALTEAAKQGVEPGTGSHAFVALLERLFPEREDFEQVATLYALNFTPGCPRLSLDEEQCRWFDDELELRHIQLPPRALFLLAQRPEEEREAAVGQLVRLRPDLPPSLLLELISEPQRLAQLDALPPEQARQYAALRAHDPAIAEQLADQPERWRAALEGSGAVAMLRHSPSTWVETSKRVQLLMSAATENSPAQVSRLIDSVASLSIADRASFDQLIQGWPRWPKDRGVQTARQLALASSAERAATLVLSSSLAFEALPLFALDVEDRKELAALVPHLSWQARRPLRSLAEDPFLNRLHQLLEESRSEVNQQRSPAERARLFEQGLDA
jgi:hypothetical protein